jgi:hypothetical protein
VNNWFGVAGCKIASLPFSWSHLIQADQGAKKKEIQKIIEIIKKEV